MHIRFGSLCLSVVLVSGTLVGLSGCGKKKEGTLATNVGAAVSDAECQQFADNLTRAVKSGNPDAVTDQLDLEALTDTALAGLNLDAKFREGFTKGFRSSMAQPTGFSRQLVDNVTQGGSF